MRAAIWQWLAVLATAAFFVWIAGNAADNMARRNMVFGLGFLADPAGFDIPWRVLDWSLTSTYGRALLVAGVNTLFVSFLGIVLATALGLALALARLSGNLLLAALSRGTIELVRNTPLLVQIVFWYFAVLQLLPQARNSLFLKGTVLNVRGLFLPAAQTGVFGWVFAGSIVLALLPRVPLLARLALPLIGVVVGALLDTWRWPVLRGFNFVGGVRLPPELLALTLGIGIYTSAFVAEVMRGSIQGVARGQAEAARSLGLSAARTMRLVVLPQALRTMLPPLTSQYLNVIKSSTLGAAIAFPEIVQIFARTVLNQSGRAIEVMTLVLGVFLVLSLAVSGVMGLWNARLSRLGMR